MVSVKSWPLRSGKPWLCLSEQFVAVRIGENGCTTHQKEDRFCLGPVNLQVKLLRPRGLGPARPLELGARSTPTRSGPGEVWARGQPRPLLSRKEVSAVGSPQGLDISHFLLKAGGGRALPLHAQATRSIQPDSQLGRSSINKPNSVAPFYTSC